MFSNEKHPNVFIFGFEQIQSTRFSDTTVEDTCNVNDVVNTRHCTGICDAFFLDVQPLLLILIEWRT